MPHAVGSEYFGLGPRLAEPRAWVLHAKGKPFRTSCGKAATLRFHLKDEPRLQLEHPRRVNVCERRNRVSVLPYSVSRRNWPNVVTVSRQCRKPSRRGQGSSRD